MLGGRSIAVVIVLAVLGFGAGYAVARTGGEDEPKAAAETTGAGLPAVPTPGKAPRIAVLGSAAALPAGPRERRKRAAKRQVSAAPSTTAPQSESPPATSEAPPAANPPTAPPSNPPASNPPPSSPPQNDDGDIIEG